MEHQNVVLPFLEYDKYKNLIIYYNGKNIYYKNINSKNKFTVSQDQQEICHQENGEESQAKTNKKPPELNYIYGSWKGNRHCESSKSRDF